MTTELVKADAGAGERGLSPAAARRMVKAERLMYGAGGVLAAVGPQTDVLWLHAPAVVAGAGALMYLWERTRAADGPGLLVSTQRALPLLTWSASYTACLVGPAASGWQSWWEIAIPAAWTTVAALARPLTRSRALRRAVETLPERVADQAAALAAAQAPVEQSAPVPVDPYVDGLRRLWAASPATGDTTLTSIRQHREDLPDFDAVIQAPPGLAVPRHLDERTVAAVFNVPLRAVTLRDVDNASPGHLAVRVALSQLAMRDREESTPEARLRRLWEQKVSGPGGMAPGMNLVDQRIQADRIRVLVQAADNQMISLPRLRLARALDMDDPELLMVESDGMARGVVTIYREHPLINIREATVEDLTMGPDGLISIGLRHDGRPARWPLYDPELGAITDLVVGAPGSGKSVTLNTLLAAERVSNIVSLVADAQNGMSLPEANGRVAHFGAGIAAVGATLAASCAVADYREQVSAANGWGSFQIGQPWSLVIISLDEINRILGAEAEVPPEYRKWITGMISRFQLTGRKLGMGIRFAGQSIHVTDLGDAEKIRANAKNGSVWMGRVNSSITQSMAADMVTDGTDVTPVPRHFGSSAADIDAAWNGGETPLGPITAGMAWLFQGGRAVLMRVFKAVKKNGTFPGLIALYEAAPIPRLTPEEEEIFQRVYAEALEAAERFLTGETDDGDDSDEGEGRPRRRKRPAAPSISVPSVPAVPKSLRDRVLEALADGQPHRTREIRTVVGVGQPDGPASGSVDNILSKLAEAGQVVRVGHGLWSLPPTEDDEPTD